MNEYRVTYYESAGYAAMFCEVVVRARSPEEIYLRWPRIAQEQHPNTSIIGGHGTVQDIERLELIGPVKP